MGGGRGEGSYQLTWSRGEVGGAGGRGGFPSHPGRLGAWPRPQLQERSRNWASEPSRDLSGGVPGDEVTGLSPTRRGRVRLRLPEGAEGGWLKKTSAPQLLGGRGDKERRGPSGRKMKVGGKGRKKKKLLREGGLESCRCCHGNRGSEVTSSGRDGVALGHGSLQSLCTLLFGGGRGEFFWLGEDERFGGFAF